jgi:hypothetical protein
MTVVRLDANNSLNYHAKETIMKRATIAKTFVITVAAALALGIAPKAKAQGVGCSNYTLRGTFAFTSTGFTTAASPAGAGMVAEVGTQTFDGTGGTTGAAMLSGNGAIYQLTIAGTYTVNADCTGTFTLMVTFPASSGIGTVPVDVFFVITGSGDEFQAMETDTGDVITRIYQRMLLVP